jgi:hypothetical protein
MEALEQLVKVMQVEIHPVKVMVVAAEEQVVLVLMAMQDKMVV